MNKFKKNIIVFFIISMMLFIQGCQYINDSIDDDSKFVQSWSNYLNRNTIYVDIDEKFSDDTKEKILESINILDEKAKGITFKTSIDYKNDDRYINIIKDIDEEYTGYEIKVAGRAITTRQKNSFTNKYVKSYKLNSNIYLMPNFYYFGSVENIVIHEMLHSLGFGHSEDPESVMYPEAGHNSMTKEDVEMINEKYPSD